jgi:small subunit ribosomal protein S4
VTFPRSSSADVYAEASRQKRRHLRERLIGLLESRASTPSSTARSSSRPIFAARQFVSHGHVKVNGKRVNIGIVPLPPAT